MKRFYKFIVLFLFFQVCFSANAQWTSYTTAHGLVHNEVYGIHVGLDGIKWFGTVGGLSKLSAYGNWTSYTTSNSELPVNYVYPVLKDSNGNLWIGTRGGGVVKYTGTTYIIYNTPQGLPSNIVRCLYEDNQGNIWLGTGDGGAAGGGVAKFNGSNWTIYNASNGLAGNTVRGITQDNQNNFWFATSTGLSKFNGTTFTNYTTLNGLTNNNLTGIAKDLTGRIWVCTWGGGVCVFDPSTQSWSNFTTSNCDISSNNIHCIAVDRFRNIWLGTYDLGLNFYSFNMNSWTLYTTANGLPHNKVNVIFIDEQDGVWVGTNGGVATNNPTVGLHDYSDIQTVKIFPNPVQDEIYITVESLNSFVTILDLNGKTVFSSTLKENNSCIKIDNLRTGQYIIRIVSDGKIYSKKIIKI